jgi:hypothetical protein
VGVLDIQKKKWSCTNRESWDLTWRNEVWDGGEGACWRVLDKAECDIGERTAVRDVMLNSKDLMPQRETDIGLPETRCHCDLQ